MLTQKIYFVVSAIFFLLLAVGHLIRAALQLDLAIAGWEAPMFASWGAAVIIGWLSFNGFRLCKKD
jgi:hypothetical protein